MEKPAVTRPVDPLVRWRFPVLIKPTNHECHSLCLGVSRTSSSFPAVSTRRGNHETISQKLSFATSTTTAFQVGEIASECAHSKRPTLRCRLALDGIVREFARSV